MSALSSFNVRLHSHPHVHLILPTASDFDPSKISRMSAIHEPSFQGIVRYTLAKSVSGEDVLEAKWVSTRIATKHIAPGTGYAVRKSDGQANAWLGDWENVYVEPDGKAFPMDFGMNLTADGDVSGL